MKQKQKLNHVYFMYILLPSHSAEAKMKRLKQAACHNKPLIKKCILPTLN